MSCRDLREITPRAFKNKIEGFAIKEKREWRKIVFLGTTCGNSMFYKRPLKERDYKGLFEDEQIVIPTKKDIEWSDRHFGRSLN